MLCSACRLKASSPLFIVIFLAFTITGAYELKNAYFYLNYLSNKESLSGWHKEYNLKRNFVQRRKMKLLLEKCLQAKGHLALAENIMKQQLPQVFSEETATEWLHTNIEPLKNELSTKMSQAQQALKADTWPRRPIS